MRALGPAALLFVFACGGSEAPRPRLVIAEAHQPAFALLYVADRLGYFADEGVDVEYRRYDSGRDAIDAVLAGEADIATVYETPVARAVLAGRDVAVLTTLHRSTRNTGLVARSDRGIASVADLDGRRVGVPFGTNAEFFLQLVLETHGVDAAAVTLVDIKPHEAATLLSSGACDAIATWNPHLAAAQDATGANGRTFLSPAYTELSMLATLRPTLATKDEGLRRLVRALVRAQKALEDDEDAAARMVAAYLDRADIDAASRFWTVLQFDASLDHLLLRILRLEAEWLVAEGAYAGPVPDFREHLAHAFLEAADPEAVTFRE